MKRSIILLIFILYVFSFADLGEVKKSVKFTDLKYITGISHYKGSKYWVVEKEKDSLFLIDIDSKQIEKSFACPSYDIYGVSFYNGFLWLCDRASNKIYRMDAATGIIDRAFDFPGNFPEGIVRTDEGVWVIEYRNNLILLHPQDGTVIKKFFVEGGTGLAYDGKYLWISNRYKDQLYQFSSKYGEIINILEAPDEFVSGITYYDNSLVLYGYVDKEIKVVDLNAKKKFYVLNKRVLKCDMTCKTHFLGEGTDLHSDIYFAVPHDLPNQKVLDIKFVPANKYKFVYDQWGQKVAHFSFDNLKHTEAHMIVPVELRHIRFFIEPEKCGSLKDIPKDTIKLYTKDGSKFRIDDPVIQSIAAKIKRESEEAGDNYYWLVRRIYKYLRDNLYYDLSGGWEIAPVILKRGSGSCSEYSFSFLAIAHALGIPARFQGSVVVRNDVASTDDVFHRWVEVFIPNYGWIPIDPSGGDGESLIHQARYFGELNDRFLITTVGCGDSKYMGWNYNYNTGERFKGNIKVVNEVYGEWEKYEKK